MRRASAWGGGPDPTTSQQLPAAQRPRSPCPSGLSFPSCHMGAVGPSLPKDTPSLGGDALWRGQACLPLRTPACQGGTHCHSGPSRPHPCPFGGSQRGGQKARSRTNSSVLAPRPHRDEGRRLEAGWAAGGHPEQMHGEWRVLESPPHSWGVSGGSDVATGVTTSPPHQREVGGLGGNPSSAAC